MRLAVQGTNDPRLLELCASGFDFHDACAKSFYGDKYELEADRNIKKALRSRAKNARFAMLYGAGLEQTAATLGLTVDEVRAGYERDKKDFPEFYVLMDKCTHDAKHQGYIETFFGRRLRVPRDRIYSATDYLIQGSAAALFKHAQNAVNELFRNTDCHILIPVHDELVMEIPRNTNLKVLYSNIKNKMINHPQIKVKLDVEFSVATYTWDKRNEYQPDTCV
jgi:DNA polymerase-1